MKAILLARVSTIDQDTESQLIKLKEYADMKGFEYTQDDIFDFDESAHHGNRVKFEKALSAARARKEQTAFCCDKIDRMVRQFLKYLVVFDELRKKGNIELHFPSDNIILNAQSPATDLFRFNMGVALAQYYSDSISDNVKRAIYKRIKLGLILCKAPYGYINVTIDEKTKTVEVDKFKATVVLRIYEWYATESYSISEIRKKVKKEFNVDLSKSMIARILGEKFYIGIAHYKKANLDYIHVYDRIVPEELFNKVQAIKKGKTQWDGKGKYGSNTSYYGGGMIRCAICGHALSPELHRGKYSYCCTEFGGKHNAQYVTEKALTDEFKKAFARLSLTEDKARKIMQDLKKSNEDNRVISRELLSQLHADQEKMNNRLSKLYDDYADRIITRQVYDMKTGQYNKELERITEKLNQVEEVSKTFYVTAGYIVELARHSSELFESSELEERRQLIKLVLLNPKWNGEKLLYDFTEPFNLLADFGVSSHNGWKISKSLNFSIV